MRERKEEIKEIGILIISSGWNEYYGPQNC
jgi:hypothetical protein